MSGKTNDILLRQGESGTPQYDYALYMYFNSNIRHASLLVRTYSKLDIVI